MQRSMFGGFFLFCCVLCEANETAATTNKQIQQYK